ncbi:TUBE1, partial [Symbiodinium sp. KB8]
SAAAATAASAASAGAAGRAPASPPAGPLHRRWADGEGRIGQPRAWLRAERRQSLALDQLLRRGWTDEEDTAARTVQWYYKQAVRLREERARRRAVEKMEGAEAAYLDSPKSVVARMNYALWCQTVGRSLERARPLYLGLVDHMARRGPDHPLILYGFCLLLAATMGESMEVIEALAQRARRADIAKGGESFADAERGFFAEALRRRPDDPEALLGMALVLTFVHGQVDAAEPLFLRAMDLAPTRRGLVEVFTFALQERGGRDYDGHEAFRRMLEKRATAEAKEVAARMLNAASGDRALLIQRVWRGYRTRDALAVLRRAAAQQGPLSGWMRVDPEPAPPGEEPMARYWFHAESGVSAWTRPTLVADWEGLRACGIVTGFGVVSGGGCELAGLWRGRAPRPGPQGWRRRLDGRGFERLAARSFAPDDSEASRWRDGQDQAAAVCPPKGRPPLLHGADPREWEEHQAPPGSDEEQFWFNRTTGESRWSAPRWDRRPATMVAIGAVTRRHAARHEESPLLTEEGSAWNYALDSLADSAQATASPKRRKFAGRMATGRGKAGWRPAPPPGMEFALRKRQRAEEAANARALFDAPLIADGPPSAPRDARSGRAAGAGHWERTSEEPSGGEEAKRDGVVVWVNAVTGEVGQCGNQIGWRFWDLALREHAAASPDGVFDEAMSAFFRNVDERYSVPRDVESFVDGSGASVSKVASLRARAVLVDMEEGVVSQVLSGPLRDLFDESQVITDVSGSGNNWCGRRALRCGGSQADAGRAARAHGFCEYGPQYGDAILERVRTALEACESPQSFFVLHSMGGGTGSGLGTYILGQLHDAFPELYRFVSREYRPGALRGRRASAAPPDDDVVTSPYNTALALAQLSEHADCVMPVENGALSSIVDRAATLAGSNALLAVDTPAHTYLACGLLARGDVLVSDVQRNIERLRSTMQLAWFNPDGFKTGICSEPPLDATRSVLALSNNCGIANTFRRMRGSFARLYTARAHLHHYTDMMGEDGASGGASGFFGGAEETFSRLIDDYEHMDASHTPPDDWAAGGDQAVLAAIGLAGGRSGDPAPGPRAVAGGAAAARAPLGRRGV